MKSDDNPERFKSSAADRAERALEQLRENVRARIAFWADEIEDEAQVRQVGVLPRRLLLQQGGSLRNVLLYMYPWELDAVPRDQLWWLIEADLLERLSPDQVRHLLHGHAPPWADVTTQLDREEQHSSAATAEPSRVGRGRQDPRPKLAPAELLKWLRRYADRKPSEPSTTKAIGAAIRRDFPGYSIPRDFLEGAIRKVYGPRPRGRRPKHEQS